jgi:hypothetical protein
VREGYFELSVLFAMDGNCNFILDGYINIPCPSKSARIKNGKASHIFRKGLPASSQWTIRKIRATNGTNIQPNPQRMDVLKANIINFSPYIRLITTPISKQIRPRVSMIISFLF